MMRSKLVMVGLVVAAVGLVGAKTVDMASDRTLEERVRDIEKVVIRDSAQPQTTVLERLEVVETRLKEMGKVGADAAKVEGKQDEQVKKELDAMQKRVADLEKRVKVAEGGKGGGGDNGDLKRSVEQLGRAVDDLKERVKRVESKR
jgi:hypothetical protein